MGVPTLHDPLRDLLRAAGREALSRFGQAQVERKADSTRVTDADRAAEAVLVEGLTRLFPDDAVIGEEGAHIQGAGGTWYVDPIDGTNAFVEGLAYWGPTMGRVDASGQVDCGAIYFPRLDELFFAVRGEGAWRDGRRIAPLPRDLDAGVVIPSRFHRWFELSWRGRCRSLGSIAAHLAAVAGHGARAGLIPPGWKPWDVVGGLCLLGEVGGAALTWSGQALDPVQDSGLPFVVGTPDSARWLRDQVRLRTLHQESTHG